MARTIPPDRFQQLIDCATQVFIERGYAHTQMADVAEAMGIAKGTLYLYVESKDALFDLVVRSADSDTPRATPAKLPIPTPRPGTTLQHVRKSVARELPLADASSGARPQAGDRPGSRADGNRARAVSHAEREAARHQAHGSVGAIPSGARSGLVRGRARNARRVALQIPGGPHRPEPVSRGPRRRHVVARVILETVVTWAVHRHWDPSPQAIDDQVAEDILVQFIVGGLVKEPQP